jgi:hypothetical protein
VRAGRFLLACGALFVVALLWNGFVHLVVLARMEGALRPLLRPDFADRTWLSLALTAAVVALFAWGYGRFARDASAGEAARYALFFGLAAGLLVDVNQYVLYPLPAGLVAAWFAGGLVEFQLYALLLRRLLPPTRR